MKQTAIDWLIDEINKLTGLNICKDEPIIEQAKQMEKKQITETFVKVSRAHQEALGNKLSLQDMIDYKKIAEVYYNEEYETKKD
jgi:hypothetical protein